MSDDDDAFSIIHCHYLNDLSSSIIYDDEAHSRAFLIVAKRLHKNVCPGAGDRTKLGNQLSFWLPGATRAVFTDLFSWLLLEEWNDKPPRQQNICIIWLSTLNDYILLYSIVQYQYVINQWHTNSIGRK